jgi:hypothetical protein
VKIILLTVLSLMMSASFAIEQEQPESNNDLRGGKPLLLVEQIDDEEKIELERTSAGDYFLVFTDEDGSHKNKIGRTKAEEIDQKYSAVFLKVQYELPADPKGCDADWKLVLRGEDQRACPKNEQKNQAIRSMFDEMKKIARP